MVVVRRVLGTKTMQALDCSHASFSAGRKPK